MVDRNFIPFWDEFSDEISKELWFPQSNSRILKPDFKRINNYWCLAKERGRKSNVWDNFPIKSSLTIDPEIEKIVKERIYSRRVRIYPTRNQKILLNKCFRAHDYIFNKTNRVIKERYKKKKKEFSESKTCIFCEDFKHEKSYTCLKHQKRKINWDLDPEKDLQSTVVKNNENVDKKEFWLRAVPNDTRMLAFR